MYKTSDAYKEAITEKVINDSISGSIKLKDGSTLTITDENLVSGSLRITHELCADYRIGTFNLGCMRLAFFDDGALLRDFSGAEITISYSMETKAGTETIPMGIFVADGSSVKRRRSTVSLTAYDYGVLFDCALSNEIRNQEKTAEKLMEYACEKCGVVFGGIDSTLPNREVLLKPFSPQIHSYRDMIGWCAALLCGYAVIDRQGELKIISPRYKVDSDGIAILEDREIAADERMNVHSTDTRAWIASLSAYCGAKAKVYKTNISISDEQAAKAVYSLEKNPLLENKSDSECDEINKAWLYFIDSFMQRGVTAEIYGDPSIDVGDVIRYSGGDIDQRRTIVGLLTKQEWRYRNFHILVSASAQLADGFADEETEGSQNEDNETDEADNSISPMKVVSQLEKRMDALSQNEGGVGVFVNEAKNAERFNDYSEDALAAEAGEYSHAEGHKTVAGGLCAHAEGYNTEASEAYTHAEGHSSRATKWFSHAEGWATLASGDCAHAEGRETEASGKYAHAEGHKTKALDDTAHAEGWYTTAGGGGLNLAGAHAEGCNTVASADGAHAEGGYTVASNTDAHAEGYNTKALGRMSHAGGSNTIASADCQTAIGKWNEEDENALFIVGCGTGEGNRKNAFVVDEEGNVYIKGNITAGGDTDSKYREGDGISLTEAETPAEYYINVKPATAGELGGVKIGKGLEIDSDGILSATSVYYAGTGISISENKEIELNVASKSELGGVIIGNGLEIDADGKLSTAGGGSGDSYEAGTGILITENEENSTISVAIDNDTITVDEGGRLKSSGVTIENAAIIQEADAKYLLHNYTYVDYIQGNKIMYGGQQNQIIVQGHVIHRSGSKAPNGATILGASKSETYDTESQTPNIPWYTSMDFPLPLYEDAWRVMVSKLYWKYISSSSGEYGYDTYKLAYLTDTGIEKLSSASYTNYNAYGGFNFSFVWDKIYPPGSTVDGHVFEFGYIQCHRISRRMNSSLKYVVETGGDGHFIPFGSLAEFNAAIALTYEPQTLTQVNETITEV